MMVLRHAGGGGGGFLAGKQVVPVNCEAEVSQRLLEASLCNDMKSALGCLADPFVDVNYVGAVCLKIRQTGVVLREESPSEVLVDYEEFRTDVTALFVAVTNGNLSLVRKLLSAGADVNLRLFRGFATAAAAREGHHEILQILLKAGSSQPACEEALLEASSHGHWQLVGPLMGSDLIRPHAAVHALVTACCRGFVEVVDALIKCGVDVNTTDRILLQSCKPSLHTNADCTALVAAIVSRQISVVHLLLEVNKVMLALQSCFISLYIFFTQFNKLPPGSATWGMVMDLASGEEFRVGAGLAEPYPITWCAVEYFEATGSILQMLLQHISPDTPHHGRTLLHHAILCDNREAVRILIKCGAQIETPVKTTRKTEFRPLHMAARLGFSTVLHSLIDSSCDLNSTTDAGETALMICARYKQEECLQVLAKAGADFGLVNIAGQSACSIARSSRWNLGFQQALLDVIRTGTVPKSTNMSVFAPLLFVAQSGDVLALKALIGHADFDLDMQDDRGFSAVMVAAMEGHVDVFRLLVYSGADVKLCNKSGENAITLSKLSKNRDLFEKVMLEFALEKGNRISGGFYALHCAARRGDLDAVKLLASKGYDINASDGDGYTPLMLAAREGNGESALSLARKLGKLHNEAENIILNALARKLVLSGSRVKKHTKGGKGATHMKLVNMVGSLGILRWGNSSCRNVICREAEVGPSLNFQRNRQRKGDANEPGIFRVMTTKNKEVHFVCDGGMEMAELWVRGIRLVTGEAIFGK
ncbi:UNVERIFIED_CONTAM: Ankyrin repeat and KH domain-containing protein mask-1 [Sesamum calycinum]|uniref:Ankyrin repeat and KH domain-containing protein mask-1 n=1 Tax=Sesamum calycinum TaxID=2727403 RepID=A0AAW2MLG7_9LAMI